MRSFQRHWRLPTLLRAGLCLPTCPTPWTVQAEWAEAVGGESRLLREHQLRLEDELRAAQAAAADAAAAARPGSADQRARASGRGQDCARAGAPGEGGREAPRPADRPQEGPRALGGEAGDLGTEPLSLAAQSGLNQARATADCVQAEVHCRTVASDRH